jgi:Tol biopolymer transport system component
MLLWPKPNFDTDTVMINVTAGNQSTGCTFCKIAFVSDRDGNPEIYSCAADGSNVVRLTHDAGNDDQPRWSPSGLQIVFVSDRSGSPEIYTMNADGSNVVRKTFSGNCQEPAWSPDGSKITYSTFNDGSQNIWMVSATGGSPSLLLAKPGIEGQSFWSPDGTQIAVSSDFFAYDFVYDIFLVNADGTNFHALTGNIFDNYDYLFPARSPSGNKIAVTIRQTIGVNQYNTQIGVMNPDGSNLTPLIGGVAPFTDISWSDDGSRILYTSLTGSRKDISWVALNGLSSATIVTNGWNPDWKHS